MRFSASTILGALSIAHLAAAAPIWGAIMAGASVLLPSLVPGSKPETPPDTTTDTTTDTPPPDTTTDTTTDTPPDTTTDTLSTYFSLTSLQSGYSLHTASLSASSSNLYANFPSQSASCETGDDPGFATFAIDRDRVLYLHTGSGPVQNFYVDRSGMGQGKLGYTTGDQPSPENAERRGWGVVDGFLYFDGAGLIACPSDIDDAWSVWVSVDVQDPGDNAGCTPFAARVDYLAEDGTAGSGPIPCEYTQ